jgi:16S rRNA (cytosine1402-N4)-methyltransferase
VHIPVLAHETIDFLQCQPDECYVDCTVGGGAHAEAILKASGRTGKLIGFDWDDEAIAAAGERLAPFGERVELRRGSYAQLLQVSADELKESVAGILFDLGVSADQVERGDRGISYRVDGPLDMRMDRRRRETAETLIARSSWQELAMILRRYGEEPHARAIARGIVQANRRRPISSTAMLARVIQEHVPQRMRKKSLARAFMAFRIAINDELNELRQGLSAALPLLRVGGRLVVISYHSLEDRIVKETFRQWGAGCTCPPGLPRCICGGHSQFSILTRKPVRASREEVHENPRARSAKLRAGERVE